MMIRDDSLSIHVSGITNDPSFMQFVQSESRKSAKRKAPSADRGGSTRHSPRKKKVKNEAASAKREKPKKKQQPGSDEEPLLLDVNPMVRYPLLLLNLALWFLGILLMAIGVSLYVNGLDTEEETNVLNTLHSSAAIITRIELITTVAGASLFVVSFCGCVGALRENSCLLQLYSLAITALVAVDLVFAVTVLYVPGSIKRVVEQTMTNSVIIHYRDSTDSERLIDAVQRSLKCCGVSDNNFRDWNSNMYFNCTHLNPSFERCSVPYSCCKTNESASAAAGADLAASLYCGRNVLNLSDHEAWYRVHMESCTDAANRYIKSNVMMLGGGCLVVVIMLSFIDMITNTVIDEIDSIRKIYDKAEKAKQKWKECREPI